MLWIPGPNEILLIVIVWAVVTLGPGLMGIVFLLRRWRRRRAEERLGRAQEPVSERARRS